MLSRLWRRRRFANDRTAETNRRCGHDLQERAKKEDTTTERNTNTMEKPKILIVDDDPDLRRGLNLRLRANHYETAYATDGFSAISMAQKERPDLIILDLGLPAGDGFVVMERL